MTQIRLATVGDAEAIAEIYAPFCESTTVSFETVAPSAVEMAARIQKVTAQYPWLVLEVSGEVAGYVYASQHRERAAYQWSVDVTAYTRPNYRRRGVGRALYTSLFGLLREQGYYKTHAGIALPNAGSVGLHEAMGMTLVGVYARVGYKLGGWHDVAWYQGTLRPQGAEPGTPVGIRALLGSEAFGQALRDGLAYYRG
jgi:L-amino acid N-acyltransferase YncA